VVLTWFNSKAADTPALTRITNAIEQALKTVVRASIMPLLSVCRRARALS
jgi:hypothetical protein